MLLLKILQDLRKILELRILSHVRAGHLSSSEAMTSNGVNQLVQDAIRNQQSRQYDQCSGESLG